MKSTPTNRGRSVGKVPAAGSGHRGAGKPVSNGKPTGPISMPTVGKHAVTHRTGRTNRTPATKPGTTAGNW